MILPIAAIRRRNAVTRVFHIVVALVVAACNSLPIVFAQHAQGGLRADLVNVINPGDARIIGLDGTGTPMLCGTDDASILQGPGLQPRGAGGLPAGTRSWECIPSVVRGDGSEPFYLEVNTNGPVNEVRLANIGFTFVLLPGMQPTLHDDGLNGDQTAGDFVFTIGPFTTRADFPYPPYYGYGDSTNPAGVYVGYLGQVEVVELNSSVSVFLIQPAVGVLNAAIPATSVRALSDDIVASPHVINIRTSARATQTCMRVGGSMTSITQPLYDVIPDDVDQFTFVSTYKIERTPNLSVSNFNAGVHSTVRVNYTGTGRSPFDSSAGYGSSGVLLGLNFLDTLDRGLWASNMSHEIIHQWSAHLNSSIGLTEGTGHYRPGSSVGSIVGGFQWDDNGDGTYDINCNLGRNGLYRASAVDMYMAGFSDGSDIGQLYVNDAIPICDGVPRVPTYTRNLSDIQAVHGVRSPGPEESQRDFIITFVAESNDRFLTETEMTFYEIFGEHLTKPVPEGQPDPFVEQGWKSIDRLWGPGVSWSTLVPRFGDINADGAVDMIDAPLFVETLLNSNVNNRWPRRADFDRNDVVDSRDIAGFTEALLAE